MLDQMAPPRQRSVGSPTSGGCGGRNESCVTTPDEISAEQKQEACEATEDEVRRVRSLSHMREVPVEAARDERPSV